MKLIKKIIEKIEILKKSQPKLRVMFQDEAGFGRINKPKRCWCKQGVRPSVPCHHIREYRYLYGAVSPQDGELFSLVMPYTNTDCMNIFLEELSKTYPDDYILLLLDNAAWHRSAAMVVPKNIELFPLLPYTPELNPIEMIWDEVREKGFRNEIFKHLEAVIDRLCLTVKELAEDVLRVASITHRKWIIDALMF
ncbi:MAG: IS630 family transposase [Christensenellales bacterium]